MTYFLCCLHIFQLRFFWLCIAWIGKIYLSWNQTEWNFVRVMSWLLILWWHLGMWLQFMHLSVFFNKMIISRKCCFSILMFFTKENYWYLFYVRCWYSDMNSNFLIHSYLIFYSSGRNLLCSSIMMILLTLVISTRLIIQFLLFSMMIIVVFDVSPKF